MLHCVTRIISGAAGSLRLEVPKAGTRPTSDRVREAIFSALDSWDIVRGSRVLDLYAGSGALGLEAASRGAAEVVLVEKHPQAAQVTARNAKIVQGSFRGEDRPRVTVARSSVQHYLETASGDRFDIVMIDPPYDLSDRALAADLALVEALLAPGGVVMVERSIRSPEPHWPSSLERLREKRYGETAVWWAELRG